MEPLKPEHTNKTTPVTGTPFQVRRVLAGYSYPVNGNVHNPTPRYHWQLILDGRLVDQADKREPLVVAARQPGAAELYREV